MTAFLPPNLLALFAPRDPIPHRPPVGKLTHEKKRDAYHGVSAFLDLFEDPADTPEPTRSETREERLERRRKEKAEANEYKLEQDLALWDPHADTNATGDPFKTLFVGRINYDTSESKLRREFETYGPIKRIRMVNDANSGKPRGYAFIEYEHERDMHSSYKHADGKKIDGRRVLVDVERARTVKGWQPRRLGGGLGGTRKGPPEVCTKYSGREEFNTGYDDGPRGGGGDRGRDRPPRDRPPPDRRRSRSRDRAPRPDRGPGDRGPPERRDRDRRDRERSERDRSSKDRDRRRRSRSRDKSARNEDGTEIGAKIELGEDGQPIPLPEKIEPGTEPEGAAPGAEPSRRDRDRGKRSRSRDRKKKRSRSRDRKRRRSRSRERRGDRPEIKSEPVDADAAAAGGGGGVDPEEDARRIRMQEEMNAMMDQEEMARAWGGDNENGGWGGQNGGEWNSEDVKPAIGMEANPEGGGAGGESHPKIMDYGHGRGVYSQDADRGYGNGYGN